MQITHDLAIGGLQQVVVNICRTIDRKKFDMSVLCLRNLGEFVPEVQKLGIRVIHLPQKKGTDYLSFFKVAKVLRQEKIEVVHTHNTQPFVDGTVAALMSGVNTIIHTDHGRIFPDKKRYMFAEWAASHFVYKVVGVSESTARNLIKYENIPPSKIMTIMNGIDESRYNISIDREQKKKELGIANNGPIIGVASRLSEEKGVNYLLEGMPAIIRTFPDITLVIAGKGHLEDNLKQTASELGLNRNVLFAGPRLDVPELLKLFDLYVLPSISEGLPMVLLEAMAASCSIVATDVGGVSTAITHGINGSLVRPRNPEALSLEIVRLLFDKGDRTRYAKNGLKVFRERFNAGIMTRKYEQLYVKRAEHLLPKFQEVPQKMLCQ